MSSCRLEGLNCFTWQLVCPTFLHFTCTASCLPPCSRWDGMVERLTLFADDERQVVVEVRETFQRRKDKLRERRVYAQKVWTQVWGRAAVEEAV